MLSEGRRGLTSYDESDFAKSRVKVGGDLIAIQARGTLSAAEMYGLRGQKELKRIYERRGAELIQRTLALRDPERGFAEDAKRYLYTELSLALNVPVGEMEQFISRHIARRLA